MHGGIQDLGRPPSKEASPIDAIILIQRGEPGFKRQIAACLAYCIDQGYQLNAIIPETAPPDSALAAVTAGLAAVVVVAYDGQSVASAVTAAGGRVEAVHPTPHVVVPARGLGVSPAVLVRWYAAGRGVEEIAGLMEETTGDIRDYLRAAGVTENPLRR